MTDTEKAALERRIDELCAEVEYDRQTSRSRLERIDQLKAENERLRQENQSLGMAAYEVGYKDASAHYELEHCPACKNIADLQEALEESARLRELCAELLKMAERHDPEWLHWPEMHDELQQLGVKIVKL